jgi:hypothetical protein
VKLRKKSIVIIAILAIPIITAGFYFWLINTPKYCLKATDVRLYSRVEIFPEICRSCTEEEEKYIKSVLDKDTTITIGDLLERFEKESILERAICRDLDVPVTIGKNVSGTLTNVSNREFSNIVIELAIYDKFNNQVGIFNINIDNLQPHKTTKFEKALSSDLCYAIDFKPNEIAKSDLDCPSLPYIDSSGNSHCEVVRITAE